MQFKPSVFGIWVSTQVGGARSIRFTTVLMTTMLLLSTPVDLSAGSRLHCRVEQHQLNDVVYQRFVERCDRIYRACVDYREKELGEPREIAGDNCMFPVKDAPEFSGPCPELLDELESSKYDDIDSVVARVRLRDWFMTDGKDSTIRFYKQDHSIKSIRELIQTQPNDVRALFYERHHKHLVETEEDVVASLRSAIKIYELDPNCSGDWMFNPNEIVHLIEDLLIQRHDNNSTVSTLPKHEFAELANSAFEALKKQYEHVYRTSENMRKLDYAQRLIEHPFLFVKDDLAKELGNILNIDPQEYIEDRRRSIIKNLTNLYVIEPVADQQQSVGMICNDYAFQIGLAIQCADLILSYVQQYQGALSPLPHWLLEAMVFLAMTASRECGPYSRDENVDFPYIHCTFCFQTLYCLPEEKQILRQRLSKVIDLVAWDENEFEYQLIKSYNDVDERSLSHYVRALALNDVALLHSVLLAKRLTYEGYKSSAIGVLDAATTRLSELEINAVPLEKMDYLGSETCNSSFSLNSEISDLSRLLSEIRKMREVLQEGRLYAFFESGRCSLRWGN